MFKFFKCLSRINLKTFNKEITFCVYSLDQSYKASAKFYKTNSFSYTLALHLRIFYVLFIPLKSLLAPMVYAPIPPKISQSPTFISDGTCKFWVITSIPSQVIPNIVARVVLFIKF